MDRRLYHDRRTTGTTTTASTRRRRCGNERGVGCSVELGAAEGLAEGPAAGGGVVGDHGAAVAGGDAERERLPVQERVALPVLAPVARQRLPPRGALALHGHRVHVAGAAHVGHQHQVEVGMAVDCEPDAALLVARDPAAAANVGLERNKRDSVRSARFPFFFCSKKMPKIEIANKNQRVDFTTDLR